MPEPPSESAAVAQCRREIAAAEAALRAGEPREDLLLLWYADWHLELRLLQDQAQGKRAQLNSWRGLLG